MSVMKDNEMMGVYQLPNYKQILKCVLKEQIQHLLDQLSEQGEEESFVVTASVKDNTFGYFGTKEGTLYMREREGVGDFLSHLKTRKKKAKSCDQDSGRTSGKKSLLSKSTPNILMISNDTNQDPPEEDTSPTTGYRLKSIILEKANKETEKGTVAPGQKHTNNITGEGIPGVNRLLIQKPTNFENQSINNLGKKDGQSVILVNQSSIKNYTDESLKENQSGLNLNQSTSETGSNENYLEKRLNANAELLKSVSQKVQDKLNARGREEESSTDISDDNKELDERVDNEIETITIKEEPVEFQEWYSWATENPSTSAMDTSMNADEGHNDESENSVEELDPEQERPRKRFKNATDLYLNESLEYSNPGQSQTNDKSDELHSFVSTTMTSIIGGNETDKTNKVTEDSSYTPEQKSSRFKTLTPQELEDLEQIRQAKSTQRNTQWGIKIFQDWSIETLGTTVDFHLLTAEQLNDLLRQFYAEAAPKNTDKRNQKMGAVGGEYHKNTFKNIRGAINRHLADIGVEYDIVRDKIFKSSNKMLDAKLKSNLGRGLSAPTTPKATITKPDLIKIASYLNISQQDPIVLRFKVWYDLTINFLPKNLEFYAKLTLNSFQFHVDDQKKEYVTLTKETKERIHQGVQESEEDQGNKRMYASTDLNACPVHALRFFLSKNNPNARALFNHYNKAALQSPSRETFWYTEKPVKMYQFARFMSDIAKEANCSKQYTAQCLRATAVGGIEITSKPVRLISTGGEMVLLEDIE